jgi:ABC-type multidrug transport system fused ATPase/permease subunit
MGSNKSGMGTLKHYFFREKFQFLKGMLMLMASQVASFYIPYLVGNVVD